MPSSMTPFFRKHVFEDERVLIFDMGLCKSSSTTPSFATCCSRRVRAHSDMAHRDLASPPAKKQFRIKDREMHFLSEGIRAANAMPSCNYCIKESNGLTNPMYV